MSKFTAGQEINVVKPLISGWTGIGIVTEYQEDTDTIKFTKKNSSETECFCASTDVEGHEDE
jgi:hypothetical protein